MAFPTTGILDDFNRANETPITTNWTTPAMTGDGAINLASNQLSGGAGFFNAYYDVATYGPDLEVFATTADIPGVGESMSVFCFMADAGTTPDGYCVRLFGGASHTGEIRILNNGSTSLLLSLGTLTTFIAGDKLGMARIGGIVEAWAYQSGAWSKLGGVLDTTYVGTATLALEMNGSRPRWDDFGGGRVVGAASADDPPIGFLGRGAGW